MGYETSPGSEYPIPLPLISCTLPLLHECVCTNSACVARPRHAHTSPSLHFHVPPFTDMLSRPSDAYHTCYVLSGLSSAQHTWSLTPESEIQLPGAPAKWDVTACAEGEQIFDEGDRVGPTHPVYAIPQDKVEAIMEYFGNKAGF